jgi:hypothetical protein
MAVATGAFAILVAKSDFGGDKRTYVILAMVAVAGVVLRGIGFQRLARGK